MDSKKRLRPEKTYAIDLIYNFIIWFQLINLEIKLTSLLTIIRMKALSFLLILLYFFVNPLVISSQTIKGRVLDQEEGIGLGGQEILLNGDSYKTDGSGQFVINNSYDDEILNLVIQRQGYDDYDLPIHNDRTQNIELGLLFLTPLDSKLATKIDEIMNADDLEIFDDQEVSSMLTAAWDPFISVANFNFRVTRFFTRGLEFQNQIYLNNLPFNQLENGRYFWSLWGGLNDVVRNQYTSHGLNTTDFSVGGTSGAGDIDLRATNMRKGTRVSMNYSNRSYEYRTMVTHSSGMQENGWAYTLSASKRWGNSGYIKGTYYDGYSYFASVDKKFNERHTINLVGFAAPTIRGRSTSTTQFMYDLAGSNFYNPNWGFQNGKVRNSREYRTHQPVVSLRHDYTVNDLTTITTTFGMQLGKFGSTRLGWLDAADPRPDYYGNLPYDNRATLSESDLNSLTEWFQIEENRQLNWDSFYDINRSRSYPVQDQNGNTTYENVSAYAVEEERYDNNKFAMHSNIVHSFSNKLDMQAGLVLQYDRVHNFKVVDDLLGGEYYLDIDGFALRESTDNSFIQNDIENPNRLLKEGDIFGWDYDIHNTNANIWSNFNIALPKLDVTLSGVVNHSSFWRDGGTANGKFPNDSKGKSETANFVHGTLKAGFNYKVNGRNYIYANAGYITKAPTSRNSFESPRTRNFLVSNLKTEKILGGELGYVLRHPKINARATLFYFDTRDAINATAFYFVNAGRTIGQFVNLISKNVDKVNYGLELGINYKLTQTVTLNLASALGEYYINSRPDLLITVDNSATDISDNLSSKSYLQNFNIRSIPQVANSFEIEYSSPQYWSVSLSANYFKDMYVDANSVRRTAILGLAVDDNINKPEYESQTSASVIEQLVQQEKLDPIFTMDLFARKSFKWGDYRLSLTASINNLLNSKDLRSGGFEQLRFDYENLDPNRWATRYFYTYGRNYNVGAALSF